MNKYVIGLDYGTNSCRAVLMKVNSPEEIASSVFMYPSGEAGVLVDKKNPHVARQSPQDYIDGLIQNVKAVLATANKQIEGFNSDMVCGLGFATTGSTIIPVDENNTPLALTEKFQSNYNAMAWLWKDHTSHDEAAFITQKASELRPEYLEKCGGTYSSEWFWSKILHLKNIDPETYQSSYSFVELCDFLPALLADVTDPLKVKRSICAAGHKAMYSDQWGGLPDKEFLTTIDPALANLRDRLFDKAYASDCSAGTISSKWADILGLKVGTELAIGAFDAHMGAVGAAIAEGRLIKIMGTSTCDLMISAKDENIKGVCGTVKDSVLPGFIGIEAGQSAVGDLFLWLNNNIIPESYGKTLNEKFKNLTEQAAQMQAGESGLLSLDWNNGNRCVLVDMNLSGLLIGQTLHTKGHEIYRALLEATAYGALKIIKRIEESGVKVSEVICCGGLAQKNPLMMQIYADVTGCNIRIAASEQTCAVGAAIFAAAVGTKVDVMEIKEKMTILSDLVYTPQAKEAEVFKKLYALYDDLHDAFGVKGNSRSLFHVMKDLNAIRYEVSHA